jgi:REP element-mobilizing transposase RayT
VLASTLIFHEVNGVPQRGQVFAKDHYYHIYNRGADRAPIFFNDQNYGHCLDLVARYRQPYGASIIAYCLMPNHYHFLLRQETDVPLSKFIGVVFNAYTQAVNRQEERTGTLFAGRFRHVWIDRDEYLIHSPYAVKRTGWSSRRASKAICKARAYSLALSAKWVSLVSPFNSSSLM